jgi:hypothetical protein
MVLGPNQLLTEMSARNIYLLGEKVAGA